MSKTKHNTHFTKHRIKGRSNPYGLCCCAMCRRGRSGGENRGVMKIKHKYRKEWKTNKPYKKGVYTD